MADYGFTLSGMELPGGQDPLGLWEVREAPAISFGAEGAAAPEEPFWRVQLPASPQEAVAILEAQARLQTAGRQDLAHAGQEIVQLSRPESASFSPTEPLAAQKNALLAATDRLQESAVSYSIFQRTDPEEQEATRQWNTFVAEVRRMVAHYACIQTDIAGSDVGLTTVSWTGDFVTHWAPGVPDPSMQLHLRSVHLALESRIALIRIVSVVATGAAGLAVKAAVPGGQVLLLPAAWRFVRDVLQELRRSWPQLQNLA
jgi:hypothetical protein